MDQVLAAWANFYVITGSAAGGLIGLTFVVVTIAGEAGRVNAEGFRTYVTPTIVHFGAVLAMAAFLSAPHQSVASLSVGFCLAGIAGMSYCGFILSRIGRTSSAYVPVWEDWIFNVIVPAILYAGLLVVAALVWRELALALYGAAAVSLVLLFTGIHNAWDIAVFTTINRNREREKRQGLPPP